MALLDKLLRVLVRTLLEIAGARRCFVLLAHGGALQVAAAADVAAARLDVRQSHPLSEETSIPHSIVQFVARTRRDVVLADAAVDPDFAGDPALLSLRSVLCAPILHHRELLGVLSTRLIRKLCTGCRVEYQATPELLKKLGIPAGKVTKFYRTPKAEEIDKPCKECAGIGYRGRTGIFELLVPDDQFRQKLLKEPKIDVLRKSARAAGMRTLQEEGILLVAKGVTSLQELQRVLSGA